MLEEAAHFPVTSELTEEGVRVTWEGVIQRFGLGHWRGTVGFKTEKFEHAASEIETNCEYLTYKLRVNIQGVKDRGYELLAVLEHEAMHMILAYMDWTTNQIIRKFVPDERAREGYIEALELIEHQVIEMIHRGFNPHAK